MKTNTHFNRLESDHKHVYNIFNYSAHEEKSKCQALVKVRLVHGTHGSIIFPEFLFFENGTWLQPVHFFPPILGKQNDSIACIISADINAGETIKITIQNYDFQVELGDRSQIFKCEVSCSVENILEYSCGEYTVVDDKYFLKLFHHTSADKKENIIHTNELWSSPWNIRGNLKCKSHSFCYFSHLPKIINDDDLTVIAMVNTEEIYIMVDDFVQPEILMPDWKRIYRKYIYIPEVYRSSTAYRKDTIILKIPLELIDIKHIYMHTQGGLTFYEVFNPFIHRIRTSKDEKLSISDDSIISAPSNMHFPDYCIIGDASRIEGLADPFNEESTSSIFKIQNCKNVNMLQFWFDNGNVDLFSITDITESTF